MRTTPFLTAGVLTLTLLTTTPALAAEPPATVAGCSATVTGVPGEQVALAPASVTEPVVSALAGLDPLGLLTGVFRSVWAGGVNALDFRRKRFGRGTDAARLASAAEVASSCARLPCRTGAW